MKKRTIFSTQNVTNKLLYSFILAEFSGTLKSTSTVTIFDKRFVLYQLCFEMFKSITCLDFDLYSGTVFPERYTRDSFVLATMCYCLRLEGRGCGVLQLLGFFRNVFWLCFITHWSTISNAICGDEWGERDGGMAFSSPFLSQFCFLLGNQNSYVFTVSNHFTVRFGFIAGEN